MELFLVEPGRDAKPGDRLGKNGDDNMLRTQSSGMPRLPRRLRTDPRPAARSLSVRYSVSRGWNAMASAPPEISANKTSGELLAALRYPACGLRPVAREMMPVRTMRTLVDQKKKAMINELACGLNAIIYSFMILDPCNGSICMPVHLSASRAVFCGSGLEALRADKFRLTPEDQTQQRRFVVRTLTVDAAYVWPRLLPLRSWCSLPFRLRPIGHDAAMHDVVNG